MSRQNPGVSIDVHECRHCGEPIHWFYESWHHDHNSRSWCDMEQFERWRKGEADAPEWADPVLVEHPVGRLFGRQTHADGREFVSFRITEGSMPEGPWNGAEWILVRKPKAADE